jgi:hypothetical protein
LLRTFVSIYSQNGDSIGQGAPRLFLPSMGEVSVVGDTGYLTVIASGGTSGESWWLDFAAPPGKTLKPRTYLRAQRASFRAQGHPGLDIIGDHRGCNELSGRFDVRDIATDATGAITRLWILFEQHCESRPAALFGEVVYRQPRALTPYFAAAENVWFPDTHVGARAAVPINVVGTRAATGAAIDRTRIRGLHRSDYEIRGDTCSGAALQPGEICQVLVRFTPSAGGPRSAQLVVTDANGLSRRVRFDSLGLGGTTSISLTSEDGDPVGDGKDYLYDPTNAVIAVDGHWGHVSGQIEAEDGDQWRFDFEAPSGDALAPGSTFDAIRYPFNGSGAGMSFVGNGGGCNEITGTFTVNDIAFGFDQTVKYLSLDFEQHCEDAAPALLGEIRYRLPGPDATAPAPPTGLSVTRDSTGRQAQIAWTNPGIDFAYAIVRYSVDGKPPTLSTTQFFAYAGSGSSVSVLGLKPHHPISVSVFPVDGVGNVGVPARHFNA